MGGVLLDPVAWDLLGRSHSDAYLPASASAQTAPEHRSQALWLGFVWDLSSDLSSDLSWDFVRDAAYFVGMADLECGLSSGLAAIVGVATSTDPSSRLPFSKGRDSVSFSGASAESASGVPLVISTNMPGNIPGDIPKN